MAAAPRQKVYICPIYNPAEWNAWRATPEGVAAEAPEHPPGIHPDFRDVMHLVVNRNGQDDNDTRLSLARIEGFNLRFKTNGNFRQYFNENANLRQKIQNTTRIQPVHIVGQAQPPPNLLPNLTLQHLGVADADANRAIVTVTGVASQPPGLVPPSVPPPDVDPPPVLLTQQQRAEVNDGSEAIVDRLINFINTGCGNIENQYYGTDRGIHLSREGARIRVRYRYETDITVENIQGDTKPTDAPHLEDVPAEMPDNFFDLHDEEQPLTDTPERRQELLKLRNAAQREFTEESLIYIPVEEFRYIGTVPGNSAVFRVQINSNQYNNLYNAWNDNHKHIPNPANLLRRAKTEPLRCGVVPVDYLRCQRFLSNAGQRIDLAVKPGVDFYRNVFVLPGDALERVRTKYFNIGGPMTQTQNIAAIFNRFLNINIPVGCPANDPALIAVDPPAPAAAAGRGGRGGHPGGRGGHPGGRGGHPGGRGGHPGGRGGHPGGYGGHPGGYGGHPGGYSHGYNDGRGYGREGGGGGYERNNRYGRGHGREGGGGSGHGRGHGREGGGGGYQYYENRHHGQSYTRDRSRSRSRNRRPDISSRRPYNTSTTYNDISWENYPGGGGSGAPPGTRTFGSRFGGSRKRKTRKHKHSKRRAHTRKHRSKRHTRKI